MQIGLVTLFPEMLSAVSDYGITGRAVKQGLVSLQCWNPRDFTEDKHQTVDDRPPQPHRVPGQQISREMIRPHRMLPGHTLVLRLSHNEVRIRRIKQR